MSAMKLLVAPNEEGRWLPRIESRPQQDESSFGPKLGRFLRLDAQIECVWPYEHAIGVLEPPALNTINPDGESLAERGASLRGGADKVGDHRAARFDNAVAHPPHPPRMLDALLVAEAEIGRKIGAHGIGVENDSIEQRRQRIRKRRLTGARQAHDQDFALHPALGFCKDGGAPHARFAAEPTPPYNSASSGRRNCS